GVGEFERGNRFRERGRTHLPSRRTERSPPLAEIETARGNRKRLAVGHRNDADVETTREQIGPLLTKLLQQRGADVADTDDDEGEVFARLEERLMNGVERAYFVPFVDHARNIAFGGALRDGVDVDVVAPERI